MEQSQTYQNHVRWYPLVHFVLMPILLINLIWQIVRTYQDFSWDRVENIAVAIALMLTVLTARLQALKAQDRVIRLEEQIRHKDLLTSELAASAQNLNIGQLIALRFASDAELPDLIARMSNGELNDAKSIKMAIKDWRGDYLRV